MAPAPLALAPGPVSLLMSPLAKLMQLEGNQVVCHEEPETCRRNEGEDGEHHRCDPQTISVLPYTPFWSLAVKWAPFWILHHQHLPCLPHLSSASASLACWPYLADQVPFRHEICIVRHGRDSEPGVDAILDRNLGVPGVDSPVCNVVAAGYWVRALVDPLMPFVGGPRQAEVADDELADADNEAHHAFVVAWRVRNSVVLTISYRSVIVVMNRYRLLGLGD